MTLLEVELKFDRIWTQIEREMGSDNVYYRGGIFRRPEGFSDTDL